MTHAYIHKYIHEHHTEERGKEAHLAIELPLNNGARNGGGKGKMVVAEKDYRKRGSLHRNDAQFTATICVL